MIGAIKEWASVALELFYPADCAVCKGAREPGSRSMLCRKCREGLRPLPRPFCERCSLPFDGQAGGDFRCSHCASKAFSFERAVCACRLTGVARDCIHRFKYNGALWLGPELAELLIAAARERIEWEQVDCVVPVPLFRARERERHFNQAEWFARRLVRALPASLSAGNLWRTRDTETQALLNAAERTENVRGAFAARRPAEFMRRRVVVVDDVFTTGATTNECARVLRAAGAASVMVLTLGRG
ncbi:MAG: ComF family protein [Verrucomicrobia bacterium]|nr:ComF family protein [Verrucomicrobiota bacterium]